MLGSISQSYIIIILAILIIFQPSGGSGMYMWSSSNTSVATVSTKGVVMTTSAVGYSLVRAADMKNPANFDTTEVGIIGPTECVALERKDIRLVVSLICLHSSTLTGKNMYT